jgi:hypothetical protein
VSRCRTDGRRRSILATQARYFPPLLLLGRYRRGRRHAIAFRFDSSSPSPSPRPPSTPMHGVNYLRSKPIESSSPISSCAQCMVDSSWPGRVVSTDGRPPAASLQGRKRFGIRPRAAGSRRSNQCRTFLLGCAVWSGGRLFRPGSNRGESLLARAKKAGESDRRMGVNGRPARATRIALWVGTASAWVARPSSIVGLLTTGQVEPTEKGRRRGQNLLAPERWRLIGMADGDGRRRPGLRARVRRTFAHA